MLILVCLTSLLSLVISWKLDTSHENVFPKLTTNVILKCHATGGYTESELKMVFRIRILKLDTKNNRWKTYASKDQSDSEPVIHPSGRNVKILGNIGQPEQSHLSVVWSIADAKTVGLYKCEVDGYNFIDELEKIATKVTKITDAPVSVKDLLDLFISQKKSIKTFQENNIRLNNSLEALRKKQGIDNSEIRREIINLQENVTELDEQYHNMSSLIKEGYYEAGNWPTGPFALPASTDKCPDSQYGTFVESVIKISLKQNPMNPKVSIVNHLKQPVIESGKYLNLRFCQKNSKIGGINWPKGSYCIYGGIGLSCPWPFKATQLKIENALTYSVKISTEKSPYYQSSGRWFKVGFCCRHDGSANTPITLPARRSFYLYRYRGKCQSVIGTKISNEWMELATNSHSIGYSFPVFHPDGDIKSGRLELCYYQKSN